MAVKSGRQVPPRLLEVPPDVHDGQQIFMQAFWDLCGDRVRGGRISYVARSTWCRDHGLSGEDAEDLIFVVGRLDIAYVDWAHKKVNKKDARPQATKEKTIGKPRPVR